MLGQAGFLTRRAVDDPHILKPRRVPDAARDILGDFPNREVQRDRPLQPVQREGGGGRREGAAVADIRGIALHQQRYRPGGAAADDVNPRLRFLQDPQIGLLPARIHAVLQRARNVGEAGPVDQLVAAGDFPGQRPQKLAMKLLPLTPVQTGEIRRMQRLNRKLRSSRAAVPQQ